MSWRGWQLLWSLLICDPVSLTIRAALQMVTAKGMNAPSSSSPSGSHSALARLISRSSSFSRINPGSFRLFSASCASHVTRSASSAQTFRSSASSNGSVVDMYVSYSKPLTRKLGLASSNAVSRICLLVSLNPWSDHPSLDEEELEAIESGICTWPHESTYLG